MTTRTLPKLKLHLLAVFAEWERDEISRRTKEGMAIKKSQGVVFGANVVNNLSKKNKEDADRFALMMKPVIEQKKIEGYTSLRRIAKRLNRRRIKTFTGQGKWHDKSVFNVLKRIESLKSDVVQSEQKKSI